MVSAPSRTILRGTAAVVVVALLLATAALTLGYEPPELGAGTVKDPANGTTVVSIQGFHWQGEDNKNKPARLVTANETAAVTELYNGDERGASWFYDVDPLENGNLLVTSTIPGDTVVYELDPETTERVWERQFDAEDTHDTAMLNDHELLVANMRNTPENGSVSNDRLFIYNVTSNETVWEWHFKNHYPNSTDNGIQSDDWTHVNDVDKIEDGRYLVSPRNFDQAIVVNRSTKEIEMRVGSDGNHEIMNEQHNPDYLEGPNGTPTVIVADSENDRVVEYVRDCGDADPRLEAGTPPDECEWDLVWELTGKFDWPRDADRLPNGNTLITDTQNHRVVEVAPNGTIVWEAYTPWGPYDAERVKYGPESNGPTMEELDVNGTYELSAPENGSVNVSERGSGGTAATSGGTSFPVWIQETTAGWPGEAAFDEFAETWEGTSQWIKPVWMAPWGFVALVTALLISVAWGVAELVYNRRRVYRRVSSLRSA